ncbi:hypothetical protein E8E13_008603 [Curvularia kusanoi]|uniref:Integral membrane protein TmpA n=1 Tax=Curvularia kusanoi TaxID=90978 RepID=A0A9P4W9Q0_CURKU|nr:hypothetical protein E8E13_008603 [Curvularia kusanoi]
MSYSQRQWQLTGPATITLCQYEHWWRQRQPRDGEQRGRSSAMPTAIPSDRPIAIFDPDKFRLVEPPQRITDLEKAIPHSHSESLQSTHTSSSLASDTALLGKQSARGSIALPAKRYPRIVRHLRHGVFAVYQRLFTSVVLVNLTIVLVILHRASWDKRRVFILDNLASFASYNFLVAILFRQDWLINSLFRTAWLVPWSFPLRVRRLMSRVYCYGGIHSGAAVTGTVWWVGFTGVLSWEGVSKGEYTPLLLVLTLIISSLLITMILLSLPQLRVRHHNTWELTHRFLGWTAILLFWAQILLLTQYCAVAAIPRKHFTHVLVATPSFWALAAITALLIYPWLLLRRWTFTATPLSPHALRLSFPHKVHKYSCLVLSSSPLCEWHPFATFPSSNTNSHEAGNSLIVSAAGDWTRSLIATASWRSKEQALLGAVQSGKKQDGVKMQFWVKSHPRAGVLSLSALYARVLIVTTGSGIGPALSSLLDRPRGQLARLVWSTRSPRKTYGDDMLQLVHRADPEALVLDTDELGRPDLLLVAYRMYVEVGAEAVFVLSNERVTRMVVGGLEKRGVPAYGPIWDS